MFGKDAYNTVKLLMRKYVKATKENCLFLQENSGNYSILTWAYNYLALILKDSEEFESMEDDEKELLMQEFDLLSQLNDLQVTEINKY